MIDDDEFGFKRDIVFSLSVSVLWLILIVGIGLCGIAGAVIGNEQLISDSLNVLNLWWLWLIVGLICLILPTVRFLIVQAGQIKKKEPSICTHGLELAQTAFIAVILTLTYLLPKILDIFITEENTFMATTVVGFVIAGVWIALWIAIIAVMWTADAKHLKHIKQLENEQIALVKHETSES